MLVSTFFIGVRERGGGAVKEGITPITQGFHCFLLNSSAQFNYK